MKNLLTILATVTLTTNIIAPLINQTNISEKKQKLNFVDSLAPPSSVNFWFGKDGKKEYEFVNTYDSGIGDRALYSFLFTYEIDDQINIDDYNYFSAVDPNQTSFSKVNWGDTAYWGDKFGDFGRWSLNDFVHWNVKVPRDGYSIFNYANVTLLDIKASSGWASIISTQKFGMSYYSEQTKDYLQFFGYQYISTDATLSGGSMWTNLGQGFKLIRW